MKNHSLANLYTESFHKNWDKIAFSDFEGKDFDYKDIAKIIKSLHLFYQLRNMEQNHATLGRQDR